MYSILIMEVDMKNKILLLGISAFMLICNPVMVFGNQITTRNLVGTWDLESTINFPSEMAIQTLDLFADGTGIQTGRLMGVSFGTPIRWQLRGGNRLQMDGEAFGMQISQIHTIELSERGTLLTFHIDGSQNIASDRPGRTIYRRR